MTEWMNNYIKANDIKIHYHRTGGNKPPLLLLHGITDNGLCWSRVAQDLQAQYDLVMTDARGHGYSDDISSGFSISILAEDAAGVIQGLSLGKTIVWGHSMGAMTAAVLAANHPHLVSSVVLEDPPLEQRNKSLPPEIIERIKQEMLELKSLSPDDRLKKAKAQNPAWDEAEIGPWAESKTQVDLNIFGEFSSLHEQPWQDVFAQLQCPGLLITGNTTNGAIVSSDIARQAGDIWKKGKVVHMATAGHSIHREQYAEVMQAVTSFLDSQEKLNQSGR